MRVYENYIIVILFLSSILLRKVTKYERLKSINKRNIKY